MQETHLKAGIQTNTFHQSDEIVFQLAHVAFMDSPGECHFAPKKGKKHHSSNKLSLPGRKSCGINNAHQECNLVHETIQKMQY